jgi:protein required for attachment to host cells
MPNTHWILVADATRARIFESDALFDHLVEVEDLTHPESRLTDREAGITDAQGRTREYAGGPSTTYSPHTDRKEHEKEVFAKQVAVELEQGLEEKKYDHLVIAAPPQFSGLLTKNLGKRVRSAVSLKVDRDFTRLKAHELPQALKRHVH